MQITRINEQQLCCWKEQIISLLDSSVRINFPSFSVGEDYGARKCEALASYLKDGSAVVFIAHEESALLGWIWCHPIDRFDKTRLHVAEFAVSGTCRRQGIGGLLLKAAEDYALANGYEEIDLLVTADNEAAVGFYENASFTAERYLMKKELKEGE